jgi:hypothetical protein
MFVSMSMFDVRVEPHGRATVRTHPHPLRGHEGSHPLRRSGPHTALSRGKGKAGRARGRPGRQGKGQARPSDQGRERRGCPWERHHALTRLDHDR